MKLFCKIGLSSAFIALATLFIGSSATFAQSSNLNIKTQQWERGPAMASSRSVEISTVVENLNRPDLLANGKTVVLALEQLSERDDWPLPAREAAIYQFTRKLAQHSSQSVDPDILEYLSGYQPQVLVEGEHGGYQPLFNIRGAAIGVENGWLRDDSALQAAAILNTDSSAWLSMYTSAQHPPQRYGYLDALNLADQRSLLEVQTEALPLLSAYPDLTAVIALTAASTGDPEATHQLLLKGSGAQLAPAIRHLSTGRSKNDLAALLEFTIAQAPAENAALAIANWAPLLNSHQGTRELLLTTLEDPTLGSAAAVALARAPDIQTIRELQALSTGQGLTAQRAKMALDINRNSLIQEQRK